MSKTKSPIVFIQNYHEFPKGWNRNHWLVPFSDGCGIIYHGHEDENDHNLCGPQVFCCFKSKRLLLAKYPNALRNAEWEATDGSQLINWVSNGVELFYFLFCHPQEKNTLLFTGIEIPELRKVLLRQYPLEYYLGGADILAE